MPPKKLPELNPIVHSRIRLAILSVLISVEKADFNYLKETTETTDGNLSTHLSKLEQAGLVKLKKSFRGKKPLTTCFITEKGRKIFSEYLKALEEFLHFEKA